MLKEDRYSEITMDLIDKGCTSFPSKLEHGDWWVGPVTPSLERLAYQVERGTKLWNECRRLPKRLPIGCAQNETANSVSPLSSQWYEARSSCQDGERFPLKSAHARPT